MIKIDKKAVTKTAIKFVAWILALSALVLVVLANCEIRSSKDGSENVVYTPLDTKDMKDYTFTYQDDDHDGDYTDDTLDFDNYKEAYNSGNYQLLYHPDDASIIVRDKNSEGYVADDYSTGYMWTSTVDLSKKPLEKLYELWRRRVSSLIIMRVYDANKNTGAIDSDVYLAGDYHVDENGNPIGYAPAKMAIKEIEGGFEVTFVYETHYIQLSVRIYMKDDVLHVEIPQESIIEQGNYRVTQIDVLPTFGCVAIDKTSGYVFYPDGSGAISYFNEENVRETETTYKWKINGETVGEKQKIGETTTRITYDDIIQNASTGVKNVSLPVFGIREDATHGAFAIIESGAADSIISYDPGGYVVELNRIYSTVTYRRPIDLAQIGGFGMSSQQGGDSAKFETDIQKKDYKMQFNFLDSSNSNYSGMASVYRNYLIKNKMISDHIDSDKMHIGVDLFMGIYEAQSIGENYIAMTTYSQAEAILKELNEQFGSKGQLSTALYGWQKGGYDKNPLAAKAAAGLGGSDGLKALSKTASDLGVILSLNVNPVDMFEGDFTARTDAAYLATKLPMYARGYGYARSYKSMFEDYLPAYVNYAKNLGVSLNIEKLGWWLYNDYSVVNAMSRHDAYNYIIEELAKIATNGVNYWTESNFYTIGSADRITALDYTHSQYDISNEAVPFYQMVIHSYIPYSSVPGNLAHDLNWMELKWAEYGYMPYFLLSEGDAAELKYTSANWLYSSNYTKWKEEVIAVANSMTEKLDCVWNSEMVEHQRLDSFIEVYSTRYANNKIVYVNYSSSDYTYEYVSANGETVTVVIPAADYIVLDYQA